MARVRIANVRMAGVASAVPEHVRTLADDAQVLGETEIARISQNIGVERRHVAPPEVCTSDLCRAAAERLLVELDWPRDSIEALIFVSQTADHFMPATACVLQNKLGLPKSCAAFDVNQGCAGYVYGMWLAGQMIAGGMKRVLLLVGDTIARLVSPQDRTVAALFGDAGTATALERDDTASPWFFTLGSDGSGGRHLTIPAGAFRHQHTAQTPCRSEREGGNTRSDEDLFMDGAEVFTFALREVPPLVAATLDADGLTTADVDAFVFHQANQFMLNYLAKRLKLPTDRVVMGLRNYGNTSSASIPLALTTELSPRLRNERLRLLMAGFGAGFSWAAALAHCGPMTMPELVVVPGG